MDIVQQIISILRDIGSDISMTISHDNTIYECLIDNTQVFNGCSLTKRLMFNVMFIEEFSEVQFSTTWIDCLTNEQCTLHRVIPYSVFGRVADKSLPIRIVMEDLYRARYNTKDSFFN